MAEENILKAFYQSGESNQAFFEGRTAQELLAFRKMPPAQLQRGISRLSAKNLLKKSGDSWQLTQAGFDKAKKIVRLHRLWELYLSHYMDIAPDHVHNDAENMEHFITPQLEAQLEKYLSNPQIDPHGTIIPK